MRSLFRLVSVVLPLLLAATFSFARTADANASGALWSFPIGINSSGSMIVAPNGDLLDEECADLSGGGSELWKLPNIAGSPQNCWDAVTDTEGNSYIFGLNEKGESAIESVDSAGKARWTTTTGSYSPWRTTPVLGSNGDVYFSAFNGLSSEVLGLDEHTGAITLESKFADVTGLYAYASGLVVVNADSDIEYLGYDGTVEHQYNTGPAISAYEAYSNAGGVNGTIFVAGYGNGCGSSSHASVEKVTPTGVAWTWTDTAKYCSQTVLAATPDGGVVFGRAETYPSADYTSIGPTGNERWTDIEAGPTGTAENGGYFPIRVDVNGVVALPAQVSYSCTRQPSEECPGTQVEYLSEGTGAPALTPLLIIGSAEGGFSPYRVAIDANRTYVTGEAIEDNVPVESAVLAFAAPGLGKDYRLSLQEALTSGDGSPPPSNGGPQVQNPPPNPAPPAKPPTNPCGTVHGGFVKRLVAAAKCAWARNQLKVQCGIAVSGWLFLPLKSLQVARTASGLLDTSKLAKPLRPIAKLYNDLSFAKYTKTPPRGFGTPKEARATIGKVKSVNRLVDLLPSLRRALREHDFNTVALDIADISGLEPCVRLLANSMAP